MKDQSTALVKGEGPEPPGWPLAKAMLLQTHFHTGLIFGKATTRQVSHFSMGLGSQEGEILQSNITQEGKKKKKALKRKQAVATGKHISSKTPQEVMLL